VFIGATVLLLLVTTIVIYGERFANVDSRTIRSVLSSDKKDSGEDKVDEVLPDDPAEGDSTPP
jgi:hypothetical protein